MLRRLTKTLILTLVLIHFTSCDKVVSDFVDGAKRETGSTPTTPPVVSNSSPMYFKITPGKINSSTTNNGVIRGAMTVTNRTLSLGSDMAMTVSISRVRLVPQ